MHLDDELIQRLVHGEPAARNEAVTTRHLESCAACRLRLTEAEREERWITEQLRRLDHPAPDIAAEAIAHRAREHMQPDTVSSIGDHSHVMATRGGAVGRRPPSRRSGTLAWARWAAGLILLLAAASVAYAVPGSPVRAWVSRVAGLNRTPSPPPQPVRAPPTVLGSAGIAVPPSARFVIRFTTTQRKGSVTVTLTNEPDISISSLYGIADFTSELDRVTIDNAGSEASYDIELPRTARWVEILVASRRILLKRGDQIVTSRGADAGGHYVLPLTSAASR